MDIAVAYVPLRFRSGSVLVTVLRYFSAYYQIFDLTYSSSDNVFNYGIP